MNDREKRSQFVNLYDLESKLDQMRCEYAMKPWYSRAYTWWSSLFQILYIKALGSDEEKQTLANCEKAVKLSREGKLP